MYTTIKNGIWDVSKPFRILTESILDKEEDEIESLVEKQDKVLIEAGYNLTEQKYKINFGEKRTENLTICDAIQCLALKDGADLVQFENGNYGYIGYYAGFNENWFEIQK